VSGPYSAPTSPIRRSLLVAPQLPPFPCAGSPTYPFPSAYSPAQLNFPAQRGLLPPSPRAPPPVADGWGPPVIRFLAPPPRLATEPGSSSAWTPTRRPCPPRPAWARMPGRSPSPYLRRRRPCVALSRAPSRRLLTLARRAPSLGFCPLAAVYPPFGRLGAAQWNHRVIRSPPVPLVWMFVPHATGSSSPERRRRCCCPPCSAARRRRRHGMPLLSSRARARRPGANPTANGAPQHRIEIAPLKP
jgi:hypothetical protein